MKEKVLTQEQWDLLADLVLAEKMHNEIERLYGEELASRIKRA